MATSATTTSAAASTYLCRHHLSVGRNCSRNYVSFARKPTGRYSVRSSADEVPSSSAATTEVEGTTESQIEVPKEPSSLISALNVEKALRGIAITDADHYGILGLKKGCSYDQVKSAYDQKLEELMNQGLEQEELSKKLDLLKESYSILSSVQERRLYDWSLARNENPDRYAWPFEVDITQTPNSPDTPPPQEPEDVEPTRLVGYFFLTWIILSITLSVALNR
ncbi:NAD(P)H-quinone oxidoreductase subunit U, chloroplastic [Cynara cardunculus var. scolymus]|uniref:DnaJ domain-containing protein n=1 Tax=Cynara cardunculus var. scolymus TaxID=59895 RepID=A0A118K0K6_CYNCS|nr:NAD(P)H-quinone oxidoreductase subunit U, chloroplastic [Cynara cardunculus var. scolymus]KVI01473.1 DnaJ domain-containing protein [Cynara cardunculus var. scolymus]